MYNTRVRPRRAKLIASSTIFLPEGTSVAKIILWTVSLLFHGTGGLGSPQCTVEANTVPANINGDVLILSVDSLAYNTARYGPTSAAAAACEAACGSLPSCNAWTFCSRQSGCGSGCSKWVAKHPKLPAGGPANREPVDADLPILGFGPWTYPQDSNGCQYAPSSRSTSDAWPYGLCTLKKVADVKQLMFHPQQPSAAVPRASGIVTEASTAASAEGWISGTLSVSADCQGLPANVCKLCSESKNTDSCLKCAQDKRAQFAEKPVNYVISKGSRAQNACAVCASLTDTKLRDRCVAAILDNTAAATCVFGSRMWGAGPPDIGACLACTAKKGDKYAGACNGCAQSSQPGRCFTCLDTYPLKICNGSDPIGTNGCRVGPNDQTPCDLCSNAALSDAVFKQCLTCHMNSALYGNQDCLDCGNYPSVASNQARCYQCVQAAKQALPTSSQQTGCASCFGSWLLPGKTQACLQCVESSATAYAAKASCASCLDGTVQRSQARQEQCLGCLRKTQVQDYSVSCVDQTAKKRLLSEWH